MNKGNGFPLELIRSIKQNAHYNDTDYIDEITDNKIITLNEGDLIILEGSNRSINPVLLEPKQSLNKYSNQPGVLNTESSKSIVVFDKDLFQGTQRAQPVAERLARDELETSTVPSHKEKSF